MAQLPPAEWIDCVSKPATSRPDGGFEAIEIRTRPADQSLFEPHPDVPSGWTIYQRCPANLSALLEFLAKGMDQFLEAPSKPGYTVEQIVATGCRKEIPDPRNVWARLLCAWQRMKAAHVWSHHHRIFTDRPSLPEMPDWPPKVLPPEEFKDRLLWSDRARQSLIEHIPRFERALSDWLSWVADRAAVQVAGNGVIPTELNTTPPADHLAPLAWPADDGWHFRPGEAAYLGVPFRITGSAFYVLKELANPYGAPRRWSDLATALPNVESADTGPNIGTIRNHVSDTRAVLRGVFDFEPSNAEPIPVVERGGDRTAWKLDSTVLRRRLIS
jgi:hypothetical protein